MDTKQPTMLHDAQTYMLCFLPRAAFHCRALWLSLCRCLFLRLVTVGWSQVGERRTRTGTQAMQMQGEEAHCASLLVPPCRLCLWTATAQPEQ